MIEKCKNCGRYPFCSITIGASMSKCENYIKRSNKEIKKLYGRGKRYDSFSKN